VRPITALRLGRVSNLPTTWTNVLAGVALSGQAAEPSLIAGLCAAVSLFYVGGMYLNDAFDRHIDAVERPERPIPSGEVSATTVFTLGFGMLAAGLVTVAALTLLHASERDFAPFAAAIALCAAIVFYDAYHKENPLSPLVMGINRVLVYLLAALSCGGSTVLQHGPLLFGCGALLCYLMGLTYVAKQETLSRLKNTWPVALLTLPFTHLEALATPEGALVYALGLGWVLYALSSLFVESRRNIGRAVAQMIAGISLVDAILVAGQGATTLALACAAGFALTRLSQRYVPGT